MFDYPAGYGRPQLFPNMTFLEKLSFIFDCSTVDKPGSGRPATVQTGKRDLFYLLYLVFASVSFKDFNAILLFQRYSSTLLE